MSYNSPVDHVPAWQFPAPARRSRFLAPSPEWRPFNIEAALDRIAPWAFEPRRVSPVLYFDYQTHLESNTPGRLGSGRAGVFRGHYVKGIGRTPAAGNWNDAADRYHGSGHMAPASAIRERLITQALEARGMGNTIVGCRSILLSRLRAGERQWVLRGKTSSQPSLTGADASLIALSVKPADFARISNIVWALHHFSTIPRHFGMLFVDFERYLHPPGNRGHLQGEPAAIARAMDRAFHRGLDNFARYNEAGLFWIYTHNNFTLDGRFVDLETPVYLGAPFVGIFQQFLSVQMPYRFLGFEAFNFAWYWRLFLAWLKRQLRFLNGPWVLDLAEQRSFLRELIRQIDAVFPPTHLVYSGEALQRRVSTKLAALLDVGRQGRAGIRELARLAFGSVFRGSQEPLTDLGWRKIDFRPAPPSVAPFEITAPRFFDFLPSSAGQAFADDVARIGSLRDPRNLLDALSPWAGPSPS